MHFLKLQGQPDPNFLGILKIQGDIRNQRIEMHQKSYGERTFEKRFAKGVTLVHIHFATRCG